MRARLAVALVLVCAAAAPVERHRPQRGGEIIIGPATQPAGPVVMAAPSLPEAWGVLTKRSIFARGGVPAAIPGAPGPDAGPDAHIALRGVVLEDNAQYSAFLEDTAGNHTMRVRPGDSIGQGRIKAINLDSLVFETPLRTTHVQVGQSLLGAPLPAPQPQPKPAGPQGPPQGGPQQGPMPNLPPGVPPEVMRQMMMAREAKMAGPMAAQ